MFSTGSIIFIVELAAAQIILLFSYPKRKMFALRYAGTLALLVPLAYFFPMPAAIRFNTFYSFFRFFVLFLYTFAGALFCFDCKKGALLAGCVGGYAIQHISYHVYSMFTLIKGFPQAWWMESAVCLFMYALFLGLLGVWAAKKQYYEYYDTSMVWISVITIIICIGLSRFARLSNRSDTITSVCLSLYAVTCCLLVLALQYFVYNNAVIKTENSTLQRIGEEEKKQYEISKANMELLNIKCHDIKQRITSGGTAGVLDSGEADELIEIYDSTLKTGLEVLDVILYEKRLQCRKEGISVTFMGNAEALSFMSVIDIYSLFGNALSNAMEAVSALDDKTLKSIGLTVEEKGDYVFINAANYYKGELVIVNGLPRTSKAFEPGFHGYGMKSIKHIAEKYNGGLTVSACDGVFNLTVYLQNSEN